MASITAIELGADACALARTSVHGEDIRVQAVETLDPAAFAGVDSFTAAIRQARRALKLPRRARVVLWGLPEGSTRTDAAVKPLVAPLTGAGFSVERVISPCDALATLARLRVPRNERATCWLAINRGGVAIVVVQPGKQLYSHSFVWDSTVGSSGSQARLLQRYSLVSYLSPEVKRAMAEARKQGTLVDAVVTCGNLPDLRSLTMPLIEELDVEVETLDSLEGLIVKAPVVDRIAEAAPAIRLACAGATAREARRLDDGKRRAGQPAGTVLRVAAALAAIAAIGFAWYQLRGFDIRAVLPRKSAAPATTIAKANPPAKPSSAPAARPSPPPVGGKTEVTAPSIVRSTPAASAPAAAPSSVRGTPAGAPAAAPSSVRNTPAGSAPAASAPGVRNTPVASAPPGVRNTPMASAPSSVRSTPAAAAPAPAPPSVVNTPVVSQPPPQPRPEPPSQRVPQPATSPAPSTSSTPRSSRMRSAPAPGPAAPAARASDTFRPTTAEIPVSSPPLQSLPEPRPAAPLLAPVPPADNPAAGIRAPERAVAQPRQERQEVMPPLLKDPMPRVTAILVANDRRFATINEGQIIAIGDVLGRRIVIGIEDRAVVLREPSGVQIRVGLGGKILGVDRGR